MKRVFTLILAAALCCTLLAGCGKAATEEPAAENTEATETTATKKDVTFKVGFDAEFPPFGFVADDGSYDGFDLAIAKEVCDRLNWTFEAVPIAWDAKDAELASGSIDCIWNGFTMQGREDAYTFSPAYYDNSIVMVVKADSGIKTLADLAGKNIITQAGSSALTALDEDTTGLTDSFGQVLESADYNNAFMELEMGTADAVAADIGVANYNIGDKADQYLILEEVVASETYGIGFLKGNTEMEKTVWEQVQAIAEDGTMATIAKKYVDYGLVVDALTLLK